MELNQVGEFGLIDLLKGETIVDPSSVVVGIGDDAAVLLPSPRQLQLLTTDMLVEGVHFDLQTTTPWQLGYKAIAVNLSDIAAMGGTPKHVVISLAVPRNTSVEFITNLYQGMKEICRKFKVNIVGGDTVSSSHGLIVNAAVTGEVEPANLVRRSGARQGDLIVVTGALGSSAAGLDLLTRGDWEDVEFAWPLVTAHLTPRPQVKAGKTVARLGATSMDDVSDGLASELNEIAHASNVGMRIIAEKLPMLAELKQAADMFCKSAFDYALYGGEDFQLLFTITPDMLDAMYKADTDVRFSVIGEVRDKAEGVVMVDNGNVIPLEPKGYNHFR